MRPVINNENLIVAQETQDKFVVNRDLLETLSPALLQEIADAIHALPEIGGKQIVFLTKNGERRVFKEQAAGTLRVEIFYAERVQNKNARFENLNMHWKGSLAS